MIRKMLHGKITSIKLRHVESTHRRVSNTTNTEGFPASNVVIFTPTLQFFALIFCAFDVQVLLNTTSPAVEMPPKRKPTGAMPEATQTPSKRPRNTTTETSDGAESNPKVSDTPETDIDNLPAPQILLSPVQ